MSALSLAVPSKGRLQEQTNAFFADAGLTIAQDGGARGYGAKIVALPQVDVRLASAGDIARAVADGEVDFGVTGEDVLREAAGGQLPILVKPLGFGRADLVVAVSAAWLDVARMADLIAVADEARARTGRRLRIATKYHAQTRAFFAAHGFDDYRLVDSAGATEGAPAAGVADAIVDITTTGATLLANGLKILADGVILKSQACLFARSTGPWSDAQRAAAAALLAPIEARAAAKASRMVTAAQIPSADTIKALTGHGCVVAGERAFHAPAAMVSAVVEVLQASDCGPVSVAAPEFVFSSDRAVVQRFYSALDELGTA
jgi:ATP phosphoribosyltransferase